MSNWFELSLKVTSARHKDVVCGLSDCQKSVSSNLESTKITLFFIVSCYESQTICEFFILTQSHFLTVPDFYRMVEYFGMTLGYGMELYIASIIGRPSVLT